MEFDLERAAEVLESTPRVLRAMLEGMSERWTMADYGPGTFSPFDVLGHLIEGERTDWMPRARRILEDGESRAFDPFDPTARGGEGDGRTVAARLDLFESLRAGNVAAVRELVGGGGAGLLDRRGRHPALGVVTLRQLLATWAVHDLHHRAQVCKAMAWQYKEEVGPWRGYLSTLPRE